MTPNGGTATATSMPMTNSGNGGGINGVTTSSSSSSSSTTPEKSPPYTAAPSSQKIIQTTTTATTTTTQQISSSPSLTTTTTHTASNNPTKKPPRNKGGGSRNNNNNNNNNANKQSASSTRSGSTAAGGTTKPNRPKSSKSTKSSTPSAAYLETHNLVLPPDSSLHTIATKSPALLHPQVTLTCYIPTNSVGAVIGRRGSTVLQIQKHAQSHSCHASGGGPVRVSIVGHTDTTSTDPTTTTANPMQQQQEQQPQSHNPTIEQHAEEGSTTSTQQHGGSGASVPYTYSPLDMSSPHWTPVVIRADPCAALAAAQRLEQMVGEFDEVVVDLPISRTRHAALVGKRGFILANLSADTQVRIMVPRRDLRHDVIQLEGELHHVHTCLERVLTLAMESSSPTTNTTNTSSSNTAGGGKKKKEKHADSALPLMGGNLPHSESKSMSLHISPPQTKLRSIGRKTDTLIKRKRVGDEEWVVTVSGNNADQVLAAIHLLEKWKEDASMTGGQPPPFTGGRGGGGRSKRGGYNNASSKRKNTNNNNANRNNNNNNNAATDQEHQQ